MTTLNKEQIQTLVGLIVTTETDHLNCDDCFGQIGEFAEYALDSRSLTEGMKVVQRHLEQCPCCASEYEVLVDALRDLAI